MPLNPTILVKDIFPVAHFLDAVFWNLDFTEENASWFSSRFCNRSAGEPWQKIGPTDLSHRWFLGPGGTGGTCWGEGEGVVVNVDWLMNAPPLYFIA